MARNFSDEIKKNKNILLVPRNSVLQGKIVGQCKVNNEEMFIINAKLQLEGLVNVGEFAVKPAIGDMIDVIILGEKGNKYMMSHLAAKREKAIQSLKKAKNHRTAVQAVVTKVSDNHYELLLGDIITTKLNKDAGDWKVGDNISVHVKEIIHKGGPNVQVILAPKEPQLPIAPGDIVECEVKSFNDFFIFVEIPNISLEQLIHVKDLTEEMSTVPGHSLRIGDKIKARVLNITNNRVFLSVKQLEEKSWEEKVQKIEINKIYDGIVRSVNYNGVLVEVNGVMGLVTRNELCWNMRDIGSVMQKMKTDLLNQKVAVKVLSIDQEKQKLFLGIKETTDHPFFSYIKLHKIGDVIEGTIVMKGESYLFVSLAPGLDGILHSSETSWEKKDADEKFAALKVNDKIKAKIMRFQKEKLGVVLSCRKLLDEKGEMALRNLQKGKVYDCHIKSIKQNGIVIAPKEYDNLGAFLYEKDIQGDKNTFKVGDTIKAKLLGKEDGNLRFTMKIYHQPFNHSQNMAQNKNTGSITSSFSNFIVEDL